MGGGRCLLTAVCNPTAHYASVDNSSAKVVDCAVSPILEVSACVKRPPVVYSGKINPEGTVVVQHSSCVVVDRARAVLQFLSEIIEHAVVVQRTPICHRHAGLVVDRYRAVVCNGSKIIDKAVTSKQKCVTCRYKQRVIEQTAGRNLACVCPRVPAS